MANYGLELFMPSVPTFTVRETDVSRHNGGSSGAPFKPLRDDSALRALSSLRGLRGAPEVPPFCRETSVSRTANVGTVGKNVLIQASNTCKNSLRLEAKKYRKIDYNYWDFRKE